MMHKKAKLLSNCLVFNKLATSIEQNHWILLRLIASMRLNSKRVEFNFNLCCWFAGLFRVNISSENFVLLKSIGL